MAEGLDCFVDFKQFSDVIHGIILKVHATSLPTPGGGFLGNHEIGFTTLCSLYIMIYDMIYDTIRSLNSRCL